MQLLRISSSLVRLLLTSCLACAWQGTVAQSALTLPSPLATPLLVVPPEFPSGATAGSPSTRVQVSGIVLADGTFEPVDIETQAGMEPFAASVRDVLKWWRFVPAIDRVACVPRRSDAAFTVWFEGSEASPRVFFSFPQATDRSSQPVKVESVDAPSLRFPKKLLAIEGQVRVLRLIDPAGEVSSVAVRSSTPAGAFDEIVLAAARKTKVTWSEPRPTEQMCVEQAYLFCMSREADAKVSFDQCRSSR